MKEPLHLLVHKGETFGSKGVEDDAGVPRIALSRSGLLDEAAQIYRLITKLKQQNSLAMFSAIKQIKYSTS